MVAGLAIPVGAIGYLVERENSWVLLSLFVVAFAAYVLMVLRRDCTVKELLVVGIIARVMLIGTTPELSDDFYRFAFDGQMLIKGENPYTILPGELETPSEYEQMLIDNMNSPEYYTVYPPINQIFFSVPALVAHENIAVYTFVLRILIVLFEILMALLLLKMLQFLRMDLRLFAWYFLNPLVIIELCGNLHFEGVTMFFFLLAVYLLMNQRLWRSGVVYAIAIGTKLIPLMLLPFFIRRLRKKSALYFAVVGVTTVLLFIPFIDWNLVQNMKSSVDLYFESFLFNGSVFYLAQEIALWIMDYRYDFFVVPLGRGFQILVVLAIVLMAILEKRSSWKSLMKKALFALLIYYSVAAIVHPWYVINLVVIGLFTGYKFPFLWSGLVMLSYTAYKPDGLVKEEPVFLWVEYGILLVAILVEMIVRKRQRVRSENVEVSV